MEAGVAGPASVEGYLAELLRRRTLDVAAAIALGASGALVGRPLYWALAAGGQAGVEPAIAILREELEIALPLLGCASIADLRRDLVR
jgi:isopentenyl diphosphate isomerase/L-lactate dehydrogenase-like FMN-dependent dehydrogenase